VSSNLAGLRYLERTYPEIEANLALDEALLVAAEERNGGPVLRVWEPDRLAVVLGASGRLHDDVDVGLCRAEGVAIARRSSGGGTVVVGPGALNVTVVLDADAAPGLNAVDTAQAYVLERFAAAIRRAGPAAEVRGLGDLTLDGRKFAGSAQRRLRRSFLVHASILYDFPIGPIDRYTRLPRRQPAYRAGRDHVSFLTCLPLPRADLLTAIRSAWPASPEAVSVPDDLVRRLVLEHFGDPAGVERL
jgi:lipoate-protein ligase A